MTKPVNRRSEPEAKVDAAPAAIDDLEAYIDSLDDAPTGDDLQVKQFVILFCLGVVVPALLLLWGWA